MRLKAREISALFLVISNVIIILLGIVRQLFAAREIDVESFGFFLLIINVITYASYLDPGFNNGLLYELPKLEAKGEKSAIQSAEKSALSLMFGISFLVVLVAGFSLLFIELHQKTFSFILFFCLAAVIMLPTNVLIVLMRVRELFVLISIVNIVASVLSLLLMYMVVKLKPTHLAYWLVLAWLTNQGLLGLIYWLKVKVSLSFNIDFKILKLLLHSGLVASFIPLSVYLFHSVDRWILSQSLTAKEFGFYSLGLAVNLALITAAQPLAHILTRRLNLAYGMEKSRAEIFQEANFLLKVLSWLQPLMSWGVFLALPLIIKILFPKYIEATHQIQVISIASLGVFALPPLSEFLISIRRAWVLIALVVLASGLKAVLIYNFGKIGFDQAAYTVVASSFILGVATVFACYRFSQKLSFFAIMKKTLIIYLPTFAVSFLVGFLMFVLCSFDLYTKTLFSSVLYGLICGAFLFTFIFKRIQVNRSVAGS